MPSDVLCKQVSEGNYLGMISIRDTVSGMHGQLLAVPSTVLHYEVIQQLRKAPCRQAALNCLSI